ncbi:MAG: murein transglycosylase, partial [Burkholderiales bacterium PBB5]
MPLPLPLVSLVARRAAAALALTLLAACASPPPMSATPAAAPQPTQASQPPLAPATPPNLATATVRPAASEARAVEPPSQDFAAWIASFSATARAAGISEATLGAAFAEVQLLPRVVELDRAQPEFTRTVWDYLDRTVTPQRLALGRSKLSQVRDAAEAATVRYGVPPSILVAIWGLESGFGTHLGDTATIDALATLGIDGRRSAWARNQLLAALQILQSGDIDRAHMVGSWAGAMGQTQFLPTTFLAYAVDADGDGRRDIWGSAADVMASPAHVLA